MITDITKQARRTRDYKPIIKGDLDKGRHDRQADTLVKQLLALALHARGGSRDIGR